MEKLDVFLREYDGASYSLLPKFLKRRVDALKKIQLEHIKLMQKYHVEVHQLELKYEKLYKPLYEKRAQIVSGEYEPTDEECKLPDEIVSQERALEDHDDDDDDDDDNNHHQEQVVTEEEEAQLKTKVKGLPSFWLGCLSSTYNFNDSIEAHDRPILKHLKDIRLSNGEKDEFFTYTIEFVFDENPHFTNKVLTKTYYLTKEPNQEDPFSFEGFEVVKSEGCEINWNPGRDITFKTVTVKQKNKVDGRLREKEKKLECDSFFHFFKPPQEPKEGEENDDDVAEELGALMAVDFEIGEALRQSIIPRAALYYTGYMFDEENDVASDDSELSDDSEGSESESNDESNDSLMNGNDKRKLLMAKRSPKGAAKPL